MKIIEIRLIIFLTLLPLMTILAQGSPTLAVAQQGDGIYSLLRKQGINPSEYYQDFLLLNKDKLGSGTQLSVGVSYLIPDASAVNKEVVVAQSPKPEEKVVEALPKEIIETPDTIPDSQPIVKSQVPPNAVNKYEIFGQEQAFVAPVSSKLEGTVYYLISGHGGPDPGAIENYKGKTIAEDEYAYDVTLRLAKELLSHGAKVYIIVRDGDDGIRDERALELDNDEVVYPNETIPSGQLDRLKQRVDAVNKLYLKHTGRYQRLIVTHVDSRSKGENIDVFFYYHENSIKGKNLAENIHQTFEKKYSKYQPNREYTGTFTDRSNLYMVKNTLPAMAYIEIGNIRNGRDQRRILDPDNRQALAHWITEGVILDYESQ